MGVFWNCPDCNDLTTWDDFGPEDDDRCHTCGALLREQRELDPWTDRPVEDGFPSRARFA